MIVMGIDNASKLSGIAVMAPDALVYHELFRSELTPNASDDELSSALSRYHLHLIALCDTYKPDKIVVELTGVARNANTMRLIAYFEAIVILVARTMGAELERVRTTSVRKKVFNNGRLDKADVVKKIINKYGVMSADEAEAVAFALSGLGKTL